MVARNIRKNPPSSYDVGESVFLRVKQKGGVKRGGNPLSRPLVHKAVILDANRETYMYKVKYTDSAGKNISESVSVNDITSLTRAEERDRQNKARKEPKTCMCLSEKCHRRPAAGCRHGMNYVCCKKESRGCKFHGVQPLSVEQSANRKYDLSSPEEITRALNDFAKDLRMAIKLSQNDNHDNLDTNIADAGLQYREPRTPGDGNCMFHAIADQLRLAGTLIDHHELRTELVNYLEENQHTANGTHMREWLEFPDWEGYLGNNES